MVRDLTQSVLYEFGPFQLDPLKRVLLRDGAPVSLTPKAFDMLLLLVEGGGKLIPKEELMNALWPDSHVEEANLTQTVFMLRKALGGAAADGAKAGATGEARNVVTVPGRGYRFTAEIREIPRNQIVSPAAPFASADSPPQPRFPNLPFLNLRFSWPLGAGVLALAFCLLAGVLLYRSVRARGRSAAAIKSTVAVLPFENLTGDPTQDYFSDGLTEELTIQLAHADPSHLAVIATPPGSSSPASSIRRERDRLQRIGRDLSVDYLLEGSVRRDSNHIRASAKLIRTREQTYIWTRQYDRELTDLLAFESEVARDIADQIRATVGGSYASAKPAVIPVSTPANFEAHDLYLKGRYFWNKRNSEALLQAIDYFDRATKRDPSYARAYAGLADSYALYSGYSSTLPNDTMPKARAAAERALLLDGNLAEAHASSALIAQDYDWDWAKAETEYRRAIALDPSYATAHQWYAEYLGLQGRFSEAFAEMGRARRLDPLSLIIAADNAVLFYYARQFGRSIEQFRSVLEMEPNFPRAHMIVYVYAQQRMLPEALSSIEKLCVPQSFEYWYMQAYAYGLSGQTAQARAAIGKLEDFYRYRPSDVQPMLLAYVAVNDKDKAFAWLDKALAERSSNLTNLKVSPMYDPLRSDPRFLRALRAMRLN